MKLSRLLFLGLREVPPDLLDSLIELIQLKKMDRACTLKPLVTATRLYFNVVVNNGSDTLHIRVMR